MSAQVQYAEGSTIRVRCTASRGIFPHEASLRIVGKARQHETLVDRDLVHIPGGMVDDSKKPASVDARVVTVNGTHLLIELPRQVIDGGRRIWIPKSQVED